MVLKKNGTSLGRDAHTRALIVIILELSPEVVGHAHRELYFQRSQATTVAPFPSELE